jgi:hypothetical protein
MKPVYLIKLILKVCGVLPLAKRIHQNVTAAKRTWSVGGARKVRRAVIELLGRRKSLKPIFEIDPQEL